VAVSHTFKGHSDHLLGMAFSPDGKHLATALGERFGSIQQPGEVMLWDLTSGKEVRTLRGGKWLVTYLTFTPDGKRLLAADVGGTVKVWDVKSGEEVRSFPYTHADVRGSMVLSPDGKRLACNSEGPDHQPMVRVYDIASGDEVVALTGHASRVTCLVYSPDGKRLVTGNEDGTVKLWDAATGQEVLTLSGHNDPIERVAFTRDGRRLVSSSRKEVKAWDATPLEEAPGK
jgi:WD40 repeat protein